MQIWLNQVPNKKQQLYIDDLSNEKDNSAEQLGLGAWRVRVSDGEENLMAVEILE